MKRTTFTVMNDDHILGDVSIHTNGAVVATAIDEASVVELQAFAKALHEALRERLELASAGPLA